MKIVFVSNFYNHHQAFLAEELYQRTNGNYWFIETGELTAERKALGWSDQNKPTYVLHCSSSEKEFSRYEQLVYEADYVITSEPWSRLLKRRLRAKKLTFHYSERLYKTGTRPHLVLARGIKYYWFAARHSSMYLLCSSGFAAQDYALTGLYRGRAYRWAYFPEVLHYDVDKLLEQKHRKEIPRILWAGRLIDWKHPEAAIAVARELKKKGLQFQLLIIGTGDQEEGLRQRIIHEKLEDCVSFMGSMSPQAVRSHMELADVYLFTSDQNEGWGAVLNESMNSCCAVVADHRIGSVPYLLHHGSNGFVYKSTEELISYTERLLLDRDLREKLARAAYGTMADTWNAKVAAERFLLLAKELSQKKTCDLYQDGGPCG